MTKRKRRRRVRDEQPYKVGRPFVEWLDEQIKIMTGNVWGTCACEKVAEKRELETYDFIRGIVKP